MLKIAFLVLMIALGPQILAMPAHAETDEEFNARFDKLRADTTALSEKQDCDVFNKCASDDRITYDQPSKPYELENKFAPAKPGRTSISDIINNQLQPSSGNR